MTENPRNATLVAIFKDAKNKTVTRCQITEFMSIEQAKNAESHIPDEDRIFVQSFEGTVPTNISMVLSNGRLNCETSTDSSYPGFDTEFIHMDEDVDDWGTRPRTLVEMEPDNSSMKTYIWGNAYNEDYTERTDTSTNYQVND